MIDEAQVRNIVKKVLDEEHLHDFIKIFEKEHNLFRGSHDKINLPENLEIPEKIITQIIRYVPEVSPYMFIDNFKDDSIHWAWLQDDVAAGKTIKEANGLLTIAIGSGVDGRWEPNYNYAPKMFIGLTGYPSEIIMKLNSYTVNDDTMSGLFISYNPTGTGATSYMCIGRRRDDSDSVDGLAVMKGSGTKLASNGLTTLPVWLRMRIGGFTFFGSKIIFSYSTDGENYTDLYTQEGAWPTAGALGASVGPFAMNWGVKNAISAPFEFFITKMMLGPG